jgi:ubiquinol-cytochrome c reductase core subunit 2
MLLAHEFHEDVERVLHAKQAALNADVAATALDNAHAIAFHTGLGSSLLPSSSTPYQKYLNEEYIASYADVAYAKPNIALIADGASPDSLSKWVGQFFKDVPSTPRSGQTLKTDATKYFGGEQRTSSSAGNSVVIAFPGSGFDSAKPEHAVLAALLGGQSTIKWAPGFSLLAKATAGTSGLTVNTSNLSYSDAGLLAVQLSGPAASVRKGAEETVKVLKSIADGQASQEDVKKAVANAKFNLLNQNQLRQPSIVLAGSGIVNSGKPYDSAAIAKAIDGVSAESIKTVRSYLESIGYLHKTNHFLYRLLRLSLRVRPPFQLSVICSCCPTLRILVYEYKWRSKREKNLYQQFRRDVGEADLFVNVCSRNPLIHFRPFCSPLSILCCKELCNAHLS